MQIRSGTAAALAALVSFASTSAIAEEKATIAEEKAKEDAVIEAGDQVSIEYTLTLDDGEVADTNVDGQPLTYEQGAGRILPALENELLGLSVGATKEVDLTAEQGYGPVDDRLYQTVPTEQIPEDARSVGAMLIAQGPEGQQHPVRVHEVNGEEIILDHNHPLAGKSLHFAVKILAIQ